MEFETGRLAGPEIEAILNALPGDLTFVGKDDKILYYNQPRAPLFGRTKAILGTSVQSCHPDKSVARVNQVLEVLKSGARDTEESWVDLDGKLVRVRYFAVRSASGEYLGCLEFAEDVTAARARQP
jgi:DUF438 domain-containing protein